MATAKKKTTASRKRPSKSAKRPERQKAGNLVTGAPAALVSDSLEPHTVDPGARPVGPEKVDESYVRGEANPTKMSKSSRTEEALCIIADNIVLRNEEDAIRLRSLVYGTDTEAPELATPSSPVVGANVTGSDPLR